MKRVVLDTNILISALFWEGPPRRIYRKIRAGELGLLMCREAEEEFSRVLAYPKFGLPTGAVTLLLKDVQAHSTPVSLSTKVDAVAEDPSDNVFLSCAVDGRADAVVSGDEHLLKLRTFRGIPILTAREFVIQENLEA